MSDSQQQQSVQREAALSSDSNNCFVCGPSNPIGLGVKFTLDGDLCRGEFTPLPQHMGYRNVTHGGIVFSLLDDVMANWLWLQGLQCFTARADIRYRSELMVGTPVRLEGWCEKRKGRLAQMQGRVIRIEDEFVVAEASGAFMVNNS
ncbi:MAG: PaaI family thioesterase [Pseudomonadota bacterium]|nr:PaaI family thioesterase [Pseudomonadota bacterium]MEC7971042.1 PaaI family thioesterase [Pseudomonadota bacterium]MEC7976103.1 PaaI family thioesterase [Pseudomonadota bacterium]MEC7991149.1 PaaI family thioesterase [Pseudomonadota bacterium]MEC8695548.1 PaaI family thioesterase [Pseudomonadota bacterium]